MREIQNPAPSGKGDVRAAVTNPRPWEAPGAFDKLTKHQQDVLGWVYLDQDIGLDRGTLQRLAAAGWIVAHKVQIPGKRSGSPIDRLPVTVTRYACPSIAAHMAWCAWCAEQPNEEAADAPTRP